VVLLHYYLHVLARERKVAALHAVLVTTAIADDAIKPSCSTLIESYMLPPVDHDTAADNTL